MAAGPPPSSDLREFTSRLARGDDRAWTEFHRSHGPLLFRFLLGLAHGDHARASEALQQTYLRIARRVLVCDAEHTWRAWLFAVARTTLLDLHRRESRFVRALRRWWEQPIAATHADATADHAQAESTLAQLDRALASLAPDERELLAAKYLRGESVAAIAERAGVSAKAVESRLTRARAALREAFQQQLLPAPDESHTTR